MIGKRCEKVENDGKSLFGGKSNIVDQNIRNRLLVGVQDLNKQLVKAALKLGKATTMCPTVMDLLTPPPPM